MTGALLCAMDECEKEAEADRMYCAEHSPRFARVERVSRQDPILSDPTGPSSTKEDGEPWEPYKPANERKPNGLSSDIPSEEKKSEGDKTRTTTRTPIESAPERHSNENTGPMTELSRTPDVIPRTEKSEDLPPGQHGIVGMPKIEKSTAPKKFVDAGCELQAEASLEQQIDFAGEISLSMNLLDESAQHLLDLMRSIGNDANARPMLRDFRQVNAIANLGKQIAALAKVKLEAIREVLK